MRKHNIINDKCCNNGEHIVNDDYSINCRRWQVKGTLFEIIATESTGRKVVDAIDTIINRDNGEIYLVSRLNLWQKTRRSIIEFNKCN